MRRSGIENEQAAMSKEKPKPFFWVYAAWKKRKDPERNKHIATVVTHIAPSRRVLGSLVGIAAGLNDAAWEYATERGAKSGMLKVRRVLKASGIEGVALKLLEISGCGTYRVRIRRLV